MASTFRIVALLAVLCAPLPTVAEPIKLKLAFFSSDRSALYTVMIKPFVDAVNAETKALINIEVFFGGALGDSQAKQAQLVADGVADLAYVVPGYTPERFTDTAVIQMPGLFRDSREATQVYSHLVAANALKGYDEFVVIGAFASEPESLHSNRPVATLADFRGLKIRTNNPAEAATLEKLGARPIVMPTNHISEAMTSGRLDASLLPTTILFEFGVARVASHHYLLLSGVAPLTLIMNRKKFESLPAGAQEVIAKYSGDWTASRYSEWSSRVDAEIIAKLNADPRRKVVFPSRSDLDHARTVYKSVIEEWVAQSPRNRELLTMVETEIARIRATRQER